MDRRMTLNILSCPSGCRVPIEAITHRLEFLAFTFRYSVGAECLRDFFLHFSDIKTEMESLLMNRALPAGKPGSVTHSFHTCFNLWLLRVVLFTLVVSITETGITAAILTKRATFQLNK